MVGSEPVDRAVLDTFLTTLHLKSGEHMSRVIGLCIEDASIHVCGVRRACVAGAFEDLKRLVGELRAVSGMLGAKRLSALCKAVEELVGMGCQSGAVNLVFAIEREMSAVKRQLMLLQSEYQAIPALDGGSLR